MDIKTLNSLMNSIQGLFHWKNLDLEFVGINDVIFEFSDAKKSHIIGKTYENVPIKYTDSMIDEFIEIDKHVINTLDTVQALSVGSFDEHQNMILNMKKFPLLDESGKVFGVAGHFIKVDNPIFVKKILSLSLSDKNHFHEISHYSQDLEQNLANLSEKEKTILFYYVRGYSASEIGNVLFNSKRTIETHLRNIKDKTFLNSKKDLINFLIDCNFLQYIPKNYLNNQKIFKI